MWVTLPSLAGSIEFVISEYRYVLESNLNGRFTDGSINCNFVFSKSDRKCNGQRKWNKTSLCRVSSWVFVSWEIRIQEVVYSHDP